MCTILNNLWEDKIRLWEDKAKELNAKYLCIIQNSCNYCFTIVTEWPIYICNDDEKEIIVNRYCNHPAIKIIKIIEMINLKGE